MITITAALYERKVTHLKRELEQPAQTDNIARQSESYLRFEFAHYKREIERKSGTPK